MFEAVGKDLKFSDSQEGCGCGVCSQIEAINQAKAEIRERIEEMFR
jgi:hypothetical protein